MKCGYVAILGRPNAGKSSLLNYLVGEEVAIVSHRKQTTRNSILGIKNGEDYQIIFIDTPGIHHSKNNLDKYMMKNVRSALASADVVLYLYDGSIVMDDEEREYIKMLQDKCKNLILVQTKTDKKQLDFNLDAIKISINNGNNINILLDKIIDFLSENDTVFEEDLYTDKSVSFLIAEKMRGFLLNNLDKEIPHGTAVVINTFEETTESVYIEADIICEREQHKGIIIGRGGSVLKRLGQETRVYAENLLNKKCIIKIFVKVEKDWRNKNIENYGY